MKKFLTLLLIIVFSIYFLVEFIGDRLIKNILQENISSTLNRDVSIEKLNINFLGGEARGKNISLLNKKFDGYLLKIDSITVDLEAFSIFSNDIIINNVLLENIKVNYYFNFSERIISDNVWSLKEDLENKNTYSQSNKYFNIKNLDAKNISLTAYSPNLNIKKTIRLDDINFNNVGNTSASRDYKDILKEVFIDTTEIIKEKIFNENFLERLENFDPNQLEDKVKDKLKNKLKKLF
tara:strand:+ start:138 stop:848 length:711 start_codon:yes stop_codon:yes gene_type:complete